MSPQSPDSASPRSLPSPVPPTGEPFSDSRAPKRARRGGLAVHIDEEDRPDSPSNMLRLITLSPHQPPLEERLQVLRELLDPHPMFVRLSRELKDSVYAEFMLETFSKNDIVFRRDESNDKFYVVQSGSACVDGRQDDEECIVRRGGFQGDLSLVQPSPKKKTLVAMSDLSIWSIEGGIYRYLVSRSSFRDFATLREFFLQCNEGRWMQVQSHDDLYTIIDGSHIEEYKEGMTVLAFESIPETVYVVKEGHMRRTSRHRSRDVTPGNCFGTEILTQDDPLPCSYSVQVTSPQAVVVCISRDAINAVDTVRSAILSFYN